MKSRSGVAGNSEVAKATHEWSDKDKQPYTLAAPANYDELDFEPQSMVGWFKPTQLVKAGLEAIVSTAFGSFADKREIELVLSEAQWHDYSDEFAASEDGLWFDYVADLGDGWDSTYGVARLLAEDSLSFRKDLRCSTDPGAPIQTQRGRLLIMGGDQVYPTSSRKEYNNRTIHPYRCALPYAPDYRKAPHLYLIPGNHDWYDGLLSFFSLFCYEHWVGGWKTWQRRSYFALKLASGDEASGHPDVWLWGIDIQLNSNIDQPQLDYFKTLAKETMQQGSRIILCTAEPSWVYVEAKTEQTQNTTKREKRKEEIYANLGYLESRVIRPYGHEVTVGLAGDVHNYTRYEAPHDKKYQRFVAGGGGAYLYPTHHMPEAITLPRKYSEDRASGDTYNQRCIFPDKTASYWLIRRSLFFSFFRSNWGFTLLLGILYLLLSWVVQSVSKVGRGNLMAGDLTLLERYGESFDFWAFIRVISHSPGSVVFLLVLIGGMVALSAYENIWKRIIHGGLHGLAHVGLFLGLFRLNAWVNLTWLHDFFAKHVPGTWGMDHPLQVVLFGAEMLFLGSIFGGILMGVFLWFSNRVLRLHDNEALLCQSDPDYKNFLRFHLAKDGKLKIYPVGIKRTNRKRSWKLNKVERNLAAWKLNTEAVDGAPWFEPRAGDIQDLAQLIEDPIEISLS